MRKVRIKSIMPIYAVALAWVLWGFLFPLYKWWHFLLAAALSLIFNRGAALIWKGEEIFVPEPAPEPEKTGNPELDRFLADGTRAAAEFSRLSLSIHDAEMKKSLSRLVTISGRIFSHIKEHPDKLPKLRRFMNYYLPTSLKLFDMYDRMGSQGVSGENIDGTMVRVETMAPVIVTAFERQLDALFADDALDIETDITVLENLLKSGGLKDA